jgi:MSHA biogenesis protein MshE
MLEMNAELTQAASQSDPTAFLKTAQALMAGQTLVHQALALVRAGRTSVAEAMRVGSDTVSDA